MTTIYIIYTPFLEIKFGEQKIYKKKIKKKERNTKKLKEIK